MSSADAAGVLNRMCLEPPADPGPLTFEKLPVLLEGADSASGSDASTRDSACSKPGSDSSSSFPSAREECHKESPTGSSSDQAVAPSVTLGFESLDGGRKEVVFLERPLGIKYSTSTPLTITKINANSHAQELGVQLGWKLRSIGDEDVAGMSTKEVLSLLRHKTNVLQLV